MRQLLRKLSTNFRNPTASWLMLVLLFVVLVPSIGLVWFLSQTIENEQLAGRQKLIDAYRAQLVSARERMEDRWRQQTIALAEQAGALPAAQWFASVVRTGSADAAICFDASGAATYPNAIPPPDTSFPPYGAAITIVDPVRAPEFRRATGEWAAAHDLELDEPATAARVYAELAAEAIDSQVTARALQAQARSLMRAGDSVAAITVLTSLAEEKRFRNAQDSQGRLIAPAASLLRIELLDQSNPAAAELARTRFQAELLDYSIAMPAPQRRFLLRQCQQHPTDPHLSTMLAAEDLAAAWIESGASPSANATLQPSPLPDIWQSGSPSGRILLLHRSDQLAARLHGLLDSFSFPADVRLDFVEPGREAESALFSLPAGESWPGWRLALVTADPQFSSDATRQRVLVYGWTVVLIVLTVVVLGLLALGLARRQVALTQLRNDLVANVTHELKTPLASMRLLVDTLLDAPRIHEPTAREYLALIASENLRLSRLINNFLTFSRIERNRYTFEFREVPAGSIAGSAATAFRERYREAPDVLTVSIGEDLPAISADAEAMATVLANLLDNAWKYTGEDKRIVLAATVHDGMVCYAVKDNGVGLSPRDSKRIFHRYYRATQPDGHGTTTGFGLGLSIVKFIVSAHGGRVAVDSEPGSGSTFSVMVPYLQTRGRPSTATAASASAT